EPRRVRGPNEPLTPPDTPPPPLTTKGWVAQDPDPVNPPKQCRINEPFDLYVDYVRFLPDNIRITGRIMNSGLPKGAYKDFVTYSLQDSYQRAPAFRSNTITQTVKNEQNLFYFSNDIVVVGSCLLGLFTSSNSKYYLKSGGHQLRLRHGGPKLGSSQITDVRETDLDHNSPIPGATMCIYDPTPVYEDGYYNSAAAHPNPSELRLFSHYMSNEDYSTLTVRDELRKIQRKKNEEVLSNEADLQKYMVNILNHISTQRRKKRPTPDLDYSYFVKYDPKKGFNVCIQGAFESVEGYYMHALGEVLPGRDTRRDISERDIKNLQVVTRRLDLSSSQRSPDWLDLKTTLRVPYDTNTIILVQIYGIKLRYKPSKSDDPNKGTVEEVEENSTRIDYDRPLAWGVLSIFEKNYAKAGLHLIAVFEGQPEREVFSLLEREGPAEDVLKTCISRRMIYPLDDALLEVEIYDGHLESEDIPEPAIDTQLEVLGIRESALRSRTTEHDAKFADYVLDSLGWTDRWRGLSSTRFKQESFIFQEKAYAQFNHSLNKALQRVGKPEVDLS
ncbi:hypothetical protein Avbf_15784, partial [Armadillidium vulgare]